MSCLKCSFCASVKLNGSRWTPGQSRTFACEWAMKKKPNQTHTLTVKRRNLLPIYGNIMRDFETFDGSRSYANNGRTQSARGLEGIALWHWIRTAHQAIQRQLAEPDFINTLYAARELHHPRYDDGNLFHISHDITQRFIGVASFIYSTRLFARSRKKCPRLETGSQIICLFLSCRLYISNLLIVTG